MLHFLQYRVVMGAFDVLTLRLEKFIWLVNRSLSLLLRERTARLSWVHTLEPVSPACAFGTLQEGLYLSATGPGTSKLVGTIRHAAGVPGTA